MTQPLTLDDIFQLFRESERQRQENDRAFRESLDRSRQDFDQRMAESKAESKAEFDRSRAEFDRSLAESRAEFERSRAEFDRRSQEAEQRLARAEAIAAQASESVDNLSSPWSRFVENLLEPAALRLFQERGFAVKEISQRVRSARGGTNLEIDLFVVDDDVAIVIEVKSRLTQSGIRQVLATLDRFKTTFPHYANYQIHGAVAAIEIDGEVDQYAENQGLFVIQQTGDTVYISTPPNFTPRAW
ncbi:hypothetical protein PROH_11635 [Prochlorothrix hollandica PCC 9006 = CALU 1027]|uniref:DUF8196 domain-containing protein n=2 Tax=Prochlorothrix hollandica TaxID=1223 RepID=A0A0M2PVW5_PROHO|nr:hypothetical protein PROH_11635 [Prochlorothrix hollandica PCC 9006 = CALU 1027]